VLDRVIAKIKPHLPLLMKSTPSPPNLTKAMSEAKTETDQGVDSLFIGQIWQRFDVRLELVVFVAHVHPLVLHDALQQRKDQ
jgi:hypothetical protein